MVLQMKSNLKQLIKRFKIRKRNSKINNKFDCNNTSFKYQNMNEGIRKKNQINQNFIQKENMIQ